MGPGWSSHLYLACSRCVVCSFTNERLKQLRPTDTDTDTDAEASFETHTDTHSDERNEFGAHTKKAEIYVAAT